jgi:hypothetical protein
MTRVVVPQYTSVSWKHRGPTDIARRRKPLLKFAKNPLQRRFQMKVRLSPEVTCTGGGTRPGKADRTNHASDKGRSGCGSAAEAASFARASCPHLGSPAELGQPVSPALVTCATLRPAAGAAPPVGFDHPRAPPPTSTAPSAAGIYTGVQRNPAAPFGQSPVTHAAVPNPTARDVVVGTDDARVDGKSPVQLRKMPTKQRFCCHSAATARLQAGVSSALPHARASGCSCPAAPPLDCFL